MAHLLIIIICINYYNYFTYFPKYPASLLEEEKCPWALL